MRIINKFMRGLIKGFKRVYISLAKSDDNDCDFAFSNLSDRTGAFKKEKDEVLESLVGMDELKEEISKIERYAVNIEKLSNMNNCNRLFPFHYMLFIEPGMGATTVIKLLADTLLEEELINGKEVAELYENLPFDSEFDLLRPQKIFCRESNGELSINDDYGVVAIDIVKNIALLTCATNKLIELMWNERGRTVFVLLATNKADNAVDQFVNKIKERINLRIINIRPYTNDELVSLGCSIFRNYGFQINESVKGRLFEYVYSERKRNSFENIKSLQRLAEKVSAEKLCANKSRKGMRILHAEDIRWDESKTEKYKESVIFELNDVIGLKSVKQQIKEIIANMVFQRKLNELGIIENPPCYHMMFIGNPGTGKTTIARMLGRLFKEIGVLSRGELYEVSRENLVGQYVGYTAPKVVDMVNRAKGSVLFVDEAYSLYSGFERNDYGYEALDTLIKEMENNRDDLVVIMAGYPDEMENLLMMNPGLYERIPYKIKFEDYTEEELTEIFFKLVGSIYTFEHGVKERVYELLRRLCKDRSKSFGNGRLARNIAERLKVKHSMRICEVGEVDINDLLNITNKDIDALYADYLQHSVRDWDVKLSRVEFNENY